MSNEKAGDREDRERIRIRALQAIFYRKLRGSGDLITEILSESDARSSAGFRGDVLDMLSVVDEPEIGPAVLKAYGGLSGELKAKAVNFLTHRAEWTKALLDQIARKQTPVVGVERDSASQAAAKPRSAGHRRVEGHMGNNSRSTRPET